ncbi:MAG: LOG family protein [Blastocatellia bacterium]|nr:LOG family protein [Blastocatellia bacterium]
MNRKPIIAVVGAGREIDRAVTDARTLGRFVGENGWVLITGGRDAGVMRAANEGAKQAKGSLTIGILPSGNAGVSPSVDVAIVTDTGEARNNIIVLTADVVIACGVDGAGTASEVALALKNGKHVILVGVNEATRKFFVGIGGEKIHVVTSPDEAMETAKGLIA